MLQRLTSFLLWALSQFRTPPRRQVAAFCWRSRDDGHEIMLITTRRTKRWTLPKGWPMNDRTLAGAAAQEAWEEAGVKGAVTESAIGSYTYEKTLRRSGIRQLVHVEVFLLQVDSIEDTYPENGQRKRKWMTLLAAAEAVTEPGLKRLIANFPA